MCSYNCILQALNGTRNGTCIKIKKSEQIFALFYCFKTNFSNVLLTKIPAAIDKL